ncbi:phosphopantetheine-binding protein [Methylocystis sp. MJC1]|jgi:acyl carrier protein|uniref:phosphopantetheine-binding protein n=1 Tax=Methylocystis sp. MJC1 TaxID=2654282 RepID=UPI0013ED5300|nr:phosphopantetheine-binding protein [Methylocystis sp. MJC1]KAF2989069.1 Aminoacyl carrier protein [Methylocystis sp. MJC1]MBU6527872.1 acyl carrier protein [Methylocystis sp. MJC1]UZX10793.1 phosphopantetheine-binding protein [Methylocystis sp. MJC1]
MIATIRRIIEQETKLAVPAARLTPHANLYDLGLTPFGAVLVLVAIEREFKIELPRVLLKRETAASIASIALAIESLRSPPVVAETPRVAA